MSIQAISPSFGCGRDGNCRTNAGRTTGVVIGAGLSATSAAIGIKDGIIKVSKNAKGITPSTLSFTSKTGAALYVAAGIAVVSCVGYCIGAVVDACKNKNC